MVIAASSRRRLVAVERHPRAVGARRQPRDRLAVARREWLSTCIGESSSESSAYSSIISTSRAAPTSLQ
jgi:hypothetical protein